MPKHTVTASDLKSIQDLMESYPNVSWTLQCYPNPKGPTTWDVTLNDDEDIYIFEAGEVLVEVLDKALASYQEERTALDLEADDAWEDDYTQDGDPEGGLGGFLDNAGAHEVGYNPPDPGEEFDSPY